MSNATKKQGKSVGRGKHPNSLANLEKGKWQKGESGNPVGMEVGTKQRGTILKELLGTHSTFRNPITKSDEKMEVEKAMDLAIVGKALKGDVTAWREVKDSVYGKIANVNELTGKDGGAIQTESKTDLTKLSIDELIEFKKMLEKVNG